MTIASSGVVSFSDLRTEYTGGSGAISYSDLYRGGTNIRAKAGDNNATNLAASVPSSGVINLSNFHGTRKAFRYTYSASATNQNVASLFGDDIDLNYPKIVEIGASITIGGTGGTAALTIPSTLAGSLTIENAGSIIGTGGSANGGNGGNAISCSASGVVLNNLTGAILAGGGGGGGRGGNGGSGGTGGQGSYTSQGSMTGNQGPNCSNYGYGDSCTAIIWGGSVVGYKSGGATSKTIGSCTYYQSCCDGSCSTFCGSGPCYDEIICAVQRQCTVTNYTNGGSGGSGGSGGNGGVGAGYNQSAASGAAGSSGSGGASGGTNAGTGGQGGTGGTGGAGGAYGSSGSGGNNGATGNSGANGNYTNGSAGSGGASGSGGGAAGAAVAGTSISINNSGSVYGAAA